MATENGLGQKISSLTRKVRRNFEDYGWRIGVLKISEAVLRPIYRRQVYCLYKIDLRNDVPDELAPSDFTFRLLTLEDQPLVEMIETQAEFLQGQLLDGIARGNLCLGAFQDGRLAGFNYIAFGEVHMPLIDLTRTFRPQTSWSVQIMVFKDFRRKGLASQLRYNIFAVLRDRGDKRLYGGTLQSNVGNLKLSKRVGFTRFVDVVYTRVLFVKSWQYRRVSGETTGTS